MKIFLCLVLLLSLACGDSATTSEAPGPGTPSPKAQNTEASTTPSREEPHRTETTERKLSAQEQVERMLAEKKRNAPIRSEASPSSEDTVSALLSRQAQAMQRFDADAWLSTFAPERREAELEIFLRMRPLPFREVVLTRLDEDDGDASIHVELLYRLHDLPEDNPFIHRLEYRLDAEGRVVEVEDDPNLPLPWRQGDVLLHRTNHFVILADPRLRDELTAASSALETAWAQLFQQRFPVTSGYLAHLTADAKSYRRISGNAGSLGVARWEYDARGEEIKTHSRAFWINGAWWLGRSRRDYSEQQRETLAHELVHLALADITRPTTPPWLKEGAAVYFSRSVVHGGYFVETRELVRRGLDRLDVVRLTEEGIAGHADAQHSVDEYLFSAQLVTELVEQRGGRDRFLDFYRAYSDVPVPWGGALGLPAGTRLAITQQLLQERYSITLEDLDRTVRERLAATHRVH